MFGETKFCLNSPLVRIKVHVPDRHMEATTKGPIGRQGRITQPNSPYGLKQGLILLVCH